MTKGKPKMENTDYSYIEEYYHRQRAERKEDAPIDQSFLFKCSEEIEGLFEWCQVSVDSKDHSEIFDVILFFNKIAKSLDLSKNFIELIDCTENFVEKIKGDYAGYLASQVLVSFCCERLENFQMVFNEVINNFVNRPHCSSILIRQFYEKYDDSISCFIEKILKSEKRNAEITSAILYVRIHIEKESETERFKSLLLLLFSQYQVCTNIDEKSNLFCLILHFSSQMGESKIEEALVSELNTFEIIKPDFGHSIIMYMYINRCICKNRITDSIRNIEIIILKKILYETQVNCHPLDCLVSAIISENLIGGLYLLLSLFSNNPRFDFLEFHACFRLINQSNLIWTFISLLLLTSNPKNQKDNIIKLISDNDITKVKIEDELMSKFEEKHYLVLSRRFVYTLFPTHIRQLSSILLFLWQSANEYANARSIIRLLFEQWVLLPFPNTYNSWRNAENESVKSEKRESEQFLTELDLYSKKFEELINSCQELKEIQPSLQHRSMKWLYDTEKNSEMIKMSKQHSIFNMLAAESMVLFANSTLFMNFEATEERQFSAPSKMTKFEYSFEIPRSIIWKEPLLNFEIWSLAKEDEV